LGLCIVLIAQRRSRPSCSGVCAQPWSFPWSSCTRTPTKDSTHSRLISPAWA